MLAGLATWTYLVHTGHIALAKWYSAVISVNAASRLTRDIVATLHHFAVWVNLPVMLEQLPCATRDQAGEQCVCAILLILDRLRCSAARLIIVVRKVVAT